MNSWLREMSFNSFNGHGVLAACDVVASGNFVYRQGYEGYEAMQLTSHSRTRSSWLLSNISNKYLACSRKTCCDSGTKQSATGWLCQVLYKR